MRIELAQVIRLNQDWLRVPHHLPVFGTGCGEARIGHGARGR